MIVFQTLTNAILECRDAPRVIWRLVKTHWEVAYAGVKTTIKEMADTAIVSCHLFAHFIR